MIPLHLRAGGVSLVLDCSGDRLPRVLHWGSDLGDLSSDDLAALVRSEGPPLASNTLDVPVPVSVLPEASLGWLGTPGLTGHREGLVASSFTVVSVGVDGNRVIVTAEDDGLTLSVEIELTPAGLVRQRATLRSTGSGRYDLDGILLALPVPERATELLDLTGRHLRERSPQRAAFRIGSWLRDGRRGRTGTDATLLLVAGEQGFGFRQGEVWALHVAWSGNHRTLAERTNGGIALLAGGELLLPGEVRLAAGESYTTPWVYGSHGHGLDAMSGRFHDHLRGRPRGPRPVTMNTWEAVYFDQRFEKLAALADAAASVGVERFVLDDGWFRGRRDDRAGLGDWYVDENVWPDGLNPLIRHVTDLGMEFGLWVEPEMVNPDSDLARAHPDWILGPASPLSRHQQVLNLHAAYSFVRDRLDALLSEYDVAYLKWDHNRDLVGAGAHRQTRAVYRLLDELRSRHPGLEIESCSSGGGRVDLGILERTDRVWASDSIDALERQQIQRWTGLLLPPELIGAHVGSPVAHTTRRQHSLDFRAGTALFGHFGIEWDLTRVGPPERERLREWVVAYQMLRPLLHSGAVVRGDHPDPAVLVHGVVAADRSVAVYALVQTVTSVQAPPGRVRLPGLDPAARYRLEPLPPGDRVEGPGVAPLPWWSAGVTLPGTVLATVGVQAPMLHPEHLVLLRATRT